MKPFHATRVLTIAGLGSLAALSALAQEAGSSYLGLSVGQSRAKYDEQGITNKIISFPVTGTPVTRNERDTAYKLLGGYQISPNLAIEGSYFDLGKASFGANTTPAGTVNGQIGMRGFGLDVVGKLPVTESLSVLARLGGHYSRYSGSFTRTGGAGAFPHNSSGHAGNYKFGVGLQYAMSPSVLLRGEAERYRADDSVGGHGHINVYSLGLVFPLGSTPTPAPRAMTTPAYVAPAPMAAPPPAPVVQAPAPAPVIVAAAPPPAPPAPVPAPMAPERKRVTFSAESLFGFDQSTLRPDGQSALDKFARDVSGTQYDRVTVEGHTDRLGSQAYNQRLSQQRADAVKTYLVTSGKFDGAKVITVGKGESTPVTRSGDCKGAKQTASMIACLQADRRVDIEVTGMR